MAEKMLTVRDLIKAMSKAGLPYTKPTLRKYEELGIIKPGVHSILYGKRVWRIYTAKEIKESVKKVQKYKLLKGGK